MAESAQTSIKTILSADSSDFEAGVKRAASALQQAEGKFKTSGKNMAGAVDPITAALGGLGDKIAAVFAVDKVLGFAEKIIGIAQQMTALQNRTGIAASTFRAWQADLQATGGNLDDLGNSIGKLEAKLGQAEGGNKAAIASFKSIGLSVQDLKDLSPDEQFLKIAQAIDKIEDPNQRAAAAISLFGRGIQSSLPFIEKLGQDAIAAGDGIDTMMTSMDENTIKQLDDFGVALDELGIKAENFGAHILTGIVAAVETIPDQLRQVNAIAANSLGNLSDSEAAKRLAVINSNLDLANDPGLGTPPSDNAPAQSAAGSRAFIDPTALQSSANSAEELQKAIQKLNDESQHNLATVGMTELQKKISDVQFSADELAKKYNTTLTPAEQASIDKTKLATEALFELQQQQTINKQLAGDLGNALGDAFESAALEGKKLSDVVGTLGQAIEKALFNAEITKPLQNFFTNSGVGSSTGGIGSLLSSVGSFFGLAGGGSIGANTPTLVGENGPEIFSPRSQGQIIPNSAIGGGGDVAVTVINNSNATVSTSAQKNGNSTSLLLQIDQAVAANMSDKGSATSQALQARESRTLTRR
jgi:hypothetical protein